jgi:hypothetical protein
MPYPYRDRRFPAMAKSRIGLSASPFEMDLILSL